jgi:hypothetical protein
MDEVVRNIDKVDEAMRACVPEGFVRVPGVGLQRVPHCRYLDHPTVSVRGWRRRARCHQPDKVTRRELRSADLPARTPVIG